MEIIPIQTGTVRIHPNQVRGKGHGSKRRLNVFRDKEWTRPLPILAWLIRHPEGDILVDTGETPQAMMRGYYPNLNPYYRSHIRVEIGPEEELGAQLRRLGVDPAALRTVLTTHLHTDHAGGLSALANAEVWTHERELALSRGLGGWIRGYVAKSFPRGFAPRTYTFTGGPVGPFARSHVVTRAGDVHVVETAGHTDGHCSVIVTANDTTYFIAGDATYDEASLLDLAVDGLSPHEDRALATLKRIADLAGSTRVVYLPTHDEHAIRRLRDGVPTRVRA
ncbi:MAG: N-acyl homoserine lactonase family protein [Gemmatimonadaceae bacterium]